jgi:YHS domain-containing protein
MFMKRRITIAGLTVFLGIALLAAGQTKNRPKPEKVRDPVCGLLVEKDPELSAHHNGRVYHFCSKSDRDQFRKDPRKYVK